MRFLAALASAFVALALVAGSAGVPAASAAKAPESPPKLMGSMAAFLFMLGGWTCVASPKSDDTTYTMYISVAPHNTVQIADRGNGTQSVGYFGFDAVAKVWYWTSVDNDGGWAAQTSPNRQDFTGTMQTRSASFPLRTAMRHLTDTKYQIVSQEQIDGTWVTNSNVTCTKN